MLAQCRGVALVTLSLCMLTIPPCPLYSLCTRQWYVFKKPVPVSPAQLAWSTEHFNSLPLVRGLTNVVRGTFTIHLLA